MSPAKCYFFLVRFFLGLLLLVAGYFPASASETPPLRHILFLNSYQQTMSWSQNILRAINDELAPDQNNIVLHVINMDTKNIFTEEYIRSFAEFLKVKIKGLNLDLIIASDNNAYDFLKEYRDELFPGIQVVFCSVNDLDLDEVQKLWGFTGVEEIFDAPGTLDLALKNHPGTEEVFIVNDFLVSGRSVTAEMRKQLQDDNMNLKFRYAEEGSVEQVNAQIRTLKPGTIVLIGAYYADQTRKHLIGYEQMGPRLVKGVSVPVYTLYAFHIHEGVIGGKVTSGYQQGKLAAILAKRILRGETAADIPVVRSGTTEFIFNYPELEKHAISVNDLPPNSKIINQPFSVFQVYQKEIMIISGLVALLLIIICMLLISMTHRRRIAAKLKENELKLKTIFNQTSHFLALLSPDGRLLDINLPALQFCQVAKTDVINRPFAETPWWNHSPQTQQQLSEQLQRAAQGHMVTFETVHPAANQQHIFEVTISPVFAGTGTVVFLTFDGHDITDKKNAEAAKEKMSEQLLQTQKLEALGTLAGGIAHDFNNLLSAVLGFTELNLLNPDCDGKIRDHSEHVKTAALRGKDLVQQILTFCRKETEKLELIEIHRIVLDALNLLRKTVPSSIAIHTDINAHTGLVMADETQLHQIVMNLCNNASHAIESGQGTIEIRLQRVAFPAGHAGKVPPLQPGHYAKLEISDSGVGMPPEILEKIFDPFFTTKEQGKGTGLGLAVVHGIIKKLKGHIHVTSEPGLGTTVSLWIPLQEQGAFTTPDQKENILTTNRKEHILWVDDERILVNLGRELMEALNYRVTATTSAREALERFRADPMRFHMVITDQTMPEMSGIQLSQAIMAIRSDIPILLCTGHSSAVNPDIALAAGVKAFLMKPLRMEDLATEIRKHLDG